MVTSEGFRNAYNGELDGRMGWMKLSAVQVSKEDRPISVNFSGGSDECWGLWRPQYVDSIRGSWIERFSDAIEPAGTNRNVLRKVDGGVACEVVGGWRGGRTTGNFEVRMWRGLIHYFCLEMAKKRVLWNILCVKERFLWSYDII